MSKTPGNRSHATDEELIDGALEGGAEGERCLESMLVRYRPWVLRRCVAMLDNRDDAEDATQEVLLRVVRGLGGYEGRSRFRTWLFTIIQHECWTVSMRRRRHLISEDVRAKMQLHYDLEARAQPMPLALMPMRDVLARMPDGARKLLQLRYLRGMALQDIALRLGLSLSATKMRLYRALERAQHLMATRAASSDRARPGRLLEHPDAGGRAWTTDARRYGRRQVSVTRSRERAGR